MNSIIINWKTTLTAIIAFAATMLSRFVGINLSIEVQMAIVTIGMLLIGLFSKDGNVTGGTKPATDEADRRV